MACYVSRSGRAALFGALSLAFVTIGAERASACYGLDCIGEAFGQGMRDTGVALDRGVRATGHAVGQGAAGLGHAADQTGRATGHALRAAGRGAHRLATGRP